MIVRLRPIDKNPVHVRAQVFTGLGDSDSTLGLSGEIVLDTAVWDDLAANLPRLIGRVTFEVVE